MTEEPPNPDAPTQPLSLKAIGMLTLLTYDVRSQHGHEGTAELSQAYLAGLTTDSVLTVRSALRELQRAGYITITRGRRTDGRLAVATYTLHPSVTQGPRLAGRADADPEASR